MFAGWGRRLYSGCYVAESGNARDSTPGRFPDPAQCAMSRDVSQFLASSGRVRYIFYLRAISYLDPTPALLLKP